MYRQSCLYLHECEMFYEVVAVAECRLAVFTALLVCSLLSMIVVYAILYVVAWTVVICVRKFKMKARGAKFESVYACMVLVVSVLVSSVLVLVVSVSMHGK
jgi:uncharacterized protein (DUF2062 family)